MGTRLEGRSEHYLGISKHSLARLAAVSSMTSDNFKNFMP